MIKKTRLVAFIIGLTLLAIMISSYMIYDWMRAGITVINNSGNYIVSVSVFIGDDEYSDSIFYHGDEVVFKFSPKRDSGLRVEIQTEDRDKYMSDSYGYLTHGDNIRYRIEIVSEDQMNIYSSLDDFETYDEVPLTLQIDTPEAKEYFIDLDEDTRKKLFDNFATISIGDTYDEVIAKMGKPDKDHDVYAKEDIDKFLMRDVTYYLKQWKENYATSDYESISFDFDEHNILRRKSTHLDGQTVYDPPLD